MLHKKLFYFDVETTGLDHRKNGIHQISGCIEIDNKVEEYFDFKVKPNSKAIIDQAALDVAGVTEEQIMAYPPMKKVYYDIIQMMAKYVNKYKKEDKFFLVGYNNCHFDDNFFRAFFVQNDDQYFNSWFWGNTIDVMVLASQHLMNKRHEMLNFKLSTVAKELLKIKIDEKKAT